MHHGDGTLELPIMGKGKGRLLQNYDPDGSLSKCSLSQL